MIENVTEDPVGSLEKLFDCHTARVVEWFMIHEQFEQNQKDLCVGCHIYPKAMRKVLKKIHSLGIIYISRRVAKSRFYKVNNESTLIKPLRLLTQNLGMQLALEEAERQMAEQN